MVIYAFAASESVGKLFLGSLIAGVLVGVFMMGITLFLAHKMNFPREEVRLTGQKSGVAARKAFPH